MLERLDTSETVDRVDELLEARYMSASLGNLEDPLDELIYIILSSKTGPNGYQPAFAALKRRFPVWDDVLDVPEDAVARILKRAGLSLQKARYIQRIVRRIRDELRERVHDGRDRANLDFLATASTEDAERFLTSLPGVSTKTARCVLMYSLDRDVFPVDAHVLRVLSRMGLLAEVHRKRAADPTQDLIPAKIRKRLHVNLIHHGRQVCRARAPKCSECSLISFCATGLQQLRTAPKSPPIAVDLFSGPGGFSAGLERAGFTIMFAADQNRNAAQTYRYNHPGVPTFETDVSTLQSQDILDLVGVSRAEVDLLVGGPPCQGYSQAGKRDPAHPSNSLYKHFARIGSQLGARLLLMENVPGLRNVQGRIFIDDIKARFVELDLFARAFLLNAADYGVPQTRRRILFMAAPKGSCLAEKLEGLVPEFQMPSGGPSATNRRQPIPPRKTVEEALVGLPPRSPGQGSEVEQCGTRWLFNHVAMRHSVEVVEKIRAIAPGEGPISYRRLVPTEPARTIIAGHRALPVHPFEDRSLTVREAARLQSFSDDFRFLGTRAEQPLQIANAVPPLLAEVIARNVRPWIEARK